MFKTTIEEVKKLGLVIKKAAYHVSNNSASLSGELWLNFLKQHCPATDLNTFQKLSSLQYSKASQSIASDEATVIFTELKKWICEHRKTGTES